MLVSSCLFHDIPGKTGKEVLPPECTARYTRNNYNYRLSFH